MSIKNIYIKLERLFWNENEKNITVIGGMVIGIIFIFVLGILGYLCLSGFCDMLIAIFMMEEGFSLSKFLIGLVKFSIGSGIPCGLMSYEDTY